MLCIYRHAAGTVPQTCHPHHENDTQSFPSTSCPCSVGHPHSLDIPAMHRKLATKVKSTQIWCVECLVVININWNTNSIMCEATTVLRLKHVHSDSYTNIHLISNTSYRHMTDTQTDRYKDSGQCCYEVETSYNNNKDFHRFETIKTTKYGYSTFAPNR